MNVPLIAYILGPIFLGLLGYTTSSKWLKPLALILQGLLFLTSFTWFASFSASPVHIEHLSRYAVPIGMALRIDVLSAVMLVLCNFLFLTLTIFNAHKYYMNKLFLFLFLSLQGLINGVFLSNDMFNVYILIEVATIVVSILIMYKKDAMAMYDGMIYLFANMVGMAFFLFGIAYIYKYFGVFDFTRLETLMWQVQDPKPLFLPVAFIMTGVSLKAALMPLFSWLPKAHSTASAPSIVSAVLSGIFVKTGVYLLMRMSSLFMPAIDMSPLFLILGYVTAISGFIFAMAHVDIKAILAYHTISQVGLMLIGFYSGYGKAVQGSLYHLLSHGIFKSLLFLLAGLLAELYHTRQITSMGGLFRQSRWLSVTLIVAVASITGAPFFSGGFSKSMIKSMVQTPIQEALLLLITVGTMVSFMKFLKLLWSETSDSQIKRSTTFILTWNQKIGLMCFMLACVLLGVYGEFFNGLIFQATIANSFWIQMQKWPIYLFQMGIAFAIYHWWVKKSKLLLFIRGVSLTFNSIMLAMFCYFAGILIYLNSTSMELFR